MSDLALKPEVVVEPTLDGEHERFKHIVLEGFYLPGDDFLPVGNSPVEGLVFGITVEALCGKRWVPDGNPAKYPMCPTCADIAGERGWKVPN